MRRPRNQQRVKQVQKKRRQKHRPHADEKQSRAVVKIFIIVCVHDDTVRAILSFRIKPLDTLDVVKKDFGEKGVTKLVQRDPDHPKEIKSHLGKAELAERIVGPPGNPSQQKAGHHQKPEQTDELDQ